MNDLVLIWSAYLVAWGLVHALAIYLEGKGLVDWLIRMAVIVLVGLIITAVALVARL